MRFTTLLLVTSIVVNCSGQELNFDTPSIDLIAGKLVYNVSGGSTTARWAFDVQFDSNNVRINQKYALTASRSYIFDKSSNEILGLINDFTLNRRFKDSYFIYYTPEELIWRALSSNYGDTIKKTTLEFKSILGYKCQKTVLKLGEQATVELWTTNKIKTGIILPGTPLSFEDVALEYELKILGNVIHRYVINSISGKKISEKEFEQVVPDEYYQVVPVSVFSLDSTWARSYEENKFSSFSYPYYGNGREATKQYIKDELSKIIEINNETRITLEFLISKDGSLNDIIINYGQKNTYSEDLKKMLQSMPKWTPAKVKGRPVNSSIKIFI